MAGYPGYRRRLTVVHSWAGVVFGGLLFAIFWMGTLSVFDREIDRWMMPATRLVAPAMLPRLDPVVAAVEPLIPPAARQWRIDLPTERTPVLRFSAQGATGAPITRQLNPSTLAPLPDAATLGASGFFFPFHYGLMIDWMDVGKWLVGAAAMAMLLMLVSGVIIHRKLFADFLTLRLDKRLPRVTLDLHNVSGVVGLPFFFMITLSGLVIFFNLYFPSAYRGAFDTGAAGQAAFQVEAYGRYRRPPAGTPGTLSSIDAMVTRAGREWGGGVPYFVRVWWPGDAQSYVELRRSYAGEVTMNLDQLYFDAATGELLQRFEAAPVMRVQRVLSGLHLIQFRHGTLRWLYFVLGLGGCVMIASGLVFWLAARPVDRAGNDPPGRRALQSLCIGSVSGIVVATLAYLAANRLLPSEAAWAGWRRSELEVLVFCLSWLACFGHAAWRGAHAWREQASVIAALALLCAGMNLLTTQNPSAVWGVDAALAVGGLLAAACARRWGRS
jgi:uncharacterized iron-regulated membrane protein